MARQGRGAPAWSGPAAGSRSVAASRSAPASGPAPASVTALRERVRRIVEPIVAAAGFDLEGISVSRAGRRHVVQVTVDRDGGVGHDDLGVLSGDLSAGLDAADTEHGQLTADPYTLEVSSRGVDRPLKLPRHWRRNVGRLVRVTIDGHLVTTRIVATDDAGVSFDRPGGAVSFDRLGPGRVQVEFSHGPDAGGIDADEIDADEVEADEVEVDEIDGDETAEYQGDGEAADGDAAQLLIGEEAGP
jgi:ribosome maturation factor RimP